MQFLVASDGCLWKQRISFTTEELEIAVATHTGTPEQILNDENRNLPVSWDDEWSLHTWLGVGQMTSTLAAEHKAIFLEDGDEIPVVNRANGRHITSVKPAAGVVMPGILWECAARSVSRRWLLEDQVADGKS